MERILFPMRTMNITTGMNMASHVGSNAIDIAGKDSGIENIYAPFSGTIKKIYEFGHTVWLESSAPVLFADGTKNYATASFTHDNNVNNLKVGQKIKQGQAFYQEGTAGVAFGNHVHLEIAKGKFSGSGWYLNRYGVWTINNSYDPTKAFWLDNVNILNGFGYTWKKVVDDMTDNTDVNELFRFYHGVSPSAAQLKLYAGKVTRADLRKRLKASAVFKKRIAEAKAGKLNPIEHAAAELRTAYVAPAINFVPITDTLYKKK